MMPEDGDQSDHLPGFQAALEQAEALQGLARQVSELILRSVENQRAFSILAQAATAQSVSAILSAGSRPDHPRGSSADPVDLKTLAEAIVRLRSAERPDQADPS